MHELSLAGGIVSMVEAAAEREHFRRVAQLRLEVGAIAGVEPQALRFALTARSRSTRFPVWPRACSAAPA
jgi:hydrogenase nickel incorporation protein HypA/HybF